MIQKEDLQRTLNRLYECRNLEISNLWQRSVFLSVFLILCFTAYGYLGLELSTKYFEKDFSDQKILLLSTVSLFVAVIGLTFSIVWILMAKGSKAWYEVYENAIYKFEKKHYLALDLPNKNRMGNMILPMDRKNSNLFSTKAGAFSPSRVNIAIGQISVIIWLILVLVHSMINHSLSIQTQSLMFSGINIIIDLLAIFASIYLVKGNYLKSSFL
jgi:hypothetical protein